MIKRLLSGFAILCVAILLISWGSAGHYTISYNASLSFYQQMVQFNTWTQFLADHASDADIRKDTDPDEAPKHYIDIDNYAAFNTTHKIPQTWDSIVAANTSVFVFSEGILPWATEATYDSLRNAFLHQDWTKAMQLAADLGHYVADGHMPLHITKNYDGQNTGNDGIHSRYESTMISAYDSQIVYTGDTVRLIPNVNRYIFNYIYKNYGYIDSVLAADNYAHAQSSNYYSQTYKSALWNKSKGFTTLLFKNASHALAELIYNAWMEAGSPTVGVAGLSAFSAESGLERLTVAPNPAINSVAIQYDVHDAAVPVKIYIADDMGKLMAVLTDGAESAGTHDARWTTSDAPAGVYFCVMQQGSRKVVKRIVIL